MPDEKTVSAGIPDPVRQTAVGDGVEGQRGRPLDRPALFYGPDPNDEVLRHELLQETFAPTFAFTRRSWDTCPDDEYVPQREHLKAGPFRHHAHFSTVRRKAGEFWYGPHNRLFPYWIRLIEKAEPYLRALRRPRRSS